MQNIVHRTQHLKLPLELYKTANKGWAVRCWDFIQAGTFVISFVGLVQL